MSGGLPIRDHATALITQQAEGLATKRVGLPKSVRAIAPAWRSASGAGRLPTAAANSASASAPPSTTQTCSLPASLLAMIVCNASASIVGAAMTSACMSADAEPSRGSTSRNWPMP